MARVEKFRLWFSVECSRYRSASVRRRMRRVPFGGEQKGVGKGLDAMLYLSDCPARQLITKEILLPHIWESVRNLHYLQPKI